MDAAAVPGETCSVALKVVAVPEATRARTASNLTETMMKVKSGSDTDSER